MFRSIACHVFAGAVLSGSILVGPMLVRAAEPTKVDRAKSAAAKLGKATMDGEYATVIDGTYPGIVKQLGGRDQAIKVTADLMKTMQAKGFKITAYRIGDAGEVLSEGGQAFVVIHTEMDARTSGATIEFQSYLLGISSDDGENWKFIDGSSLGDKTVRDQVLPKLPERLKLPTLEPPKITPDK